MLKVYLYFFAILFIAYFVMKYKDGIYSFFSARKNLTKAILAITIFASLALASFLCLFGIDYTDTPFQQHLIESENSLIYPPSFGTKLITNWMLKPFCYSLLASRFIGLFLLLLIILVPILTYYKTNKYRCSLKELFLIILCCDTTILFSYNCVSFDRLSNLFISLIFSVSYIYIKNKDIKQIILLAILLAFVISVRLPNGIIAPLLVLFLFIVNYGDWKRMIIHIATLTIISLIVFFILVICAYDSILDYFNHTLAKMTMLSTTGASHSSSNMLLSILRDSTTMILYLSIATAIILVLYKTQIESYRLKSIISALFVAAIAFMLYNSGHTYSSGLGFFKNAITLFLLLFILYKKEYNLFVLLLICFIMPIVGSDTGLLKLNTNLCLAFTALYFVRNTHNYHAIVIPLIAMLFYLPFKYQSNIYEDSGISKLTSTVKVDRLANIHTTPERAHCIENSCKAIADKRAEGYDVLVIGTHRHLFEYLMNYFNPIEQPWFTDCNDDFVIRKLDEYLKQNKDKNQYIILFYDKPLFEGSKMEKYFASKNFEYQFIICE